MTKEQQNAIDFFKLTIDMDDDKDSEDCQTIQSAKTAIDAIQKVSALQEVLDEMEDEFILNVKDAYENGYNSAIREFMDKIEEKCGLETYGLRTVAEEEENWAKITDVINAVCGGNGADYIVADDRHLFLKCRSVDTDFGVYDICKIGGDTGLELPDSEIDEFFEQSEKAMSERFSLSEESINEITSQPWEDWADRAEALGEKPLADYLKPVCDYLYGLLEPLTKEEIDEIRKNMTERDKMDVLSYKVLRCLADEVIITEKAEDIHVYVCWQDEEKMYLTLSADWKEDSDTEEMFICLTDKEKMRFVDELKVLAREIGWNPEQGDAGFWQSRKSVEIDFNDLVWDDPVEDLNGKISAYVGDSFSEEEYREMWSRTNFGDSLFYFSDSVLLLPDAWQDKDGNCGILLIATGLAGGEIQRAEVPLSKKEKTCLAQKMKEMREMREEYLSELENSELENI